MNQKEIQKNQINKNLPPRLKNVQTVSNRFHSIFDCISDVPYISYFFFPHLSAKCFPNTTRYLFQFVSQTCLPIKFLFSGFKLILNTSFPNSTLVISAAV